ncbi:MAG: methyltransferase domain-containing protein [Thermoanaerobaculia bacterium]|nr:methyltransferase domain-containing protein [Thermoanaerobaculia bacterium]
MAFRDHFSTVAGAYSTARPTYPAALFDWLASTVDRHRRCWDCATGSGQAAGALAERFDRVVATDASLEQVLHAAAHPGVSYSVAEASASGLAATSVDLVTVAQALHWLDLEAFRREVRRVVRSGGVCAAWTYALFRVDERIDDRIDEFAERTVGTFWPPERRHVDSGYRTLPLGLEAVETPTFVMRHHWSLDQVLAYVGTWSAVTRFRRARGFDPVSDLDAVLEPVWGQREDSREIRWRVDVVAGRL